jgi:hypothetical protein
LEINEVVSEVSVPAYGIDKEEVVAFRAALTALPASLWSDALPSFEFIKGACANTIAAQDLSRTYLANRLAGFSQRRSNSGLLLLSGFPEDVHPLSCLAVITTLMGEIFHVPDEGD